MNYRPLLILCALVFFCTGSATWAQPNLIFPETWQSDHNRDHPLVGQIFTAQGQAVPESFMMRQARLTRFVLLGENHDNPDHHIIQANIITALADEHHRPAVVFEMVPMRLADQLSKFDLVSDPQLDDFAKRLEWEKRGWYSWSIYRPIALAAANNNLPMIAGNLDRMTTREISSKGLSVLESSKQLAFGLKTPFSKDTEEEFMEELRRSHCDLLPQKALPAMVNVQRARDGSMADAMIRASQKFGAVLIAGNGHIRKDRGVPFVLRQNKARIQESHNLAIALVEVSPEQPSFADYEFISKSGAAHYDFVVFTPKFDTTDHCAAMREQFKNMKKIKP